MGGFWGWSWGGHGDSVMYLGDTEHHLLNHSTLLCVGGWSLWSLLAMTFSAVFYASEHLTGWHEFHGPLVPPGLFTASQTIQMNLMFFLLSFQPKD